MKKLNTLFILAAFSFSNAMAQTAPAKQWDARFGGSSDDALFSLQQTADGGYILGGYSLSGISGDKTQPGQGDEDYWIVKTDGNGVKQWDARFGGSKTDVLRSLKQTTDGGYILGGYSYSGISGDKTQPGWGQNDYWIVKTDGNGVKQWDARFGGSGSDYLVSLQQSSDGGYILGGFSYSGISGDKSQGSQGADDYWIVKTDGNGIKQWDARFGGNKAESLSALQQTADGGYILGGWSESGISGDKTQKSQGGTDYWLIKTDATGVKQWDARFGGSDYDFLNALQQTTDGGYILGGNSPSGIGGDKTQASQGANDYWLVKTDGNGVKEWDARFGGSEDDLLFALQQTADGGYILGGWSDSGMSGDKTEASQGFNDYWIVKTDGNGIKEWETQFGGSERDALSSLQQTDDGGYVLGGWSESGISGDKSQASQGLNDYWLVKTESAAQVNCGIPSDLLVSDVSAASVKISWSPATGAEYYKAGYTIKGSNEWIAVKDPVTGAKIFNTSITITGLTPNTSYRWKVAAFCNGELNPPGGFKGPSFTTLPLRLASTKETAFEVHPNPFSAYTTISFTLNQISGVKIELVDLVGRNLLSVLDENMTAGEHEVNLHGEQLTPGIYFIKLLINGEVTMKKVVIERSFQN